MLTFRNIIVLFLLTPTFILAQSSTSFEMSSSRYAIRHSAVTGAGGTMVGQKYTLEQKFSAPNLGRMEGGQFVIGTTVLLLSDYQDQLPDAYMLEQNYPNPFNQSTTFQYSLPEKSEVTLSVYSILGRQIAILLHGEQEAGRYSLRYDGSDNHGQILPSGLYFCRLATKGFDKTIKFAILR